MKKKNRASVSSKPIKMTDAELSKKLGHYQAMSVIWFWWSGWRSERCHFLALLPE